MHPCDTLFYTGLLCCYSAMTLVCDAVITVAKWCASTFQDRCLVNSHGGARLLSPSISAPVVSASYRTESLWAASNSARATRSPHRQQSCGTTMARALSSRSQFAKGSLALARLARQSKLHFAINDAARGLERNRAPAMCDGAVAMCVCICKAMLTQHSGRKGARKVFFN